MRAEARCRHASHDPTAASDRCDRGSRTARLHFLDVLPLSFSANARQLESNAVATLVDSHVRDNRAQTGGAIYVSGNATLTIDYSSIVDNSGASEQIK